MCKNLKNNNNNKKFLENQVKKVLSQMLGPEIRKERRFFLLSEMDTKEFGDEKQGLCAILFR